MYTTTAIITLLAAAAQVSAHGKIAAITGDQGGNGTALGIKGAVVPGSGPNSVTEVDTTVFWSKSIKTDNDIGYTEDGTGNNQLTDLKSAMALSGSTLPQVSTGGSVSGTWHIVTTDGAGPIEAIVDESATGKFSTAKTATITTQVPGSNGNIAATGKRATLRRALAALGLIEKRADNVNKDYPFAVKLSSDTACTGTMSGQSNVCLVKISNNNANGPFGGVFAIQMSGSSNSTKRSMKLVARINEEDLE